MIWNLAIVAVVVVILIIITRRLPDAREKFNEEREVTPGEMSIYGQIAKADEAFEKRDYTQAENLYVKAAASDPDNPKIYSRLGAIYLEKKNYYDAKDAFYHAAKLEPDLASRHINLGLAFMGLKDYFKAVEAFKKALELDKKNKKYQSLYDKAQKAFEKEKKKVK